MLAPMVQKGFVIRIREGLHARPAAMFVKRANQFGCDVWVEKDDEQVNGKSIMGLMMLAAEFGSKITVTAEGQDAEGAIRAIEELIEGGFKQAAQGT